MNINPVLELNYSGKITFYNNATINVLKEVGLKEDAALFLPDDINEILKELEHKNEGQLYREKKIKGHTFAEYIHLVTQFNTVRIYIRDITDRKHAEMELYNSEERFRSVAETAKDAIISIDSNGIIVYWNPAAENIFGHRVDEIIGKPIETIMPERYRQAHKNGVNRVASANKPDYTGTSIEVEGVKKDGSEFPIEVSVSSWKMGKNRYFTGIVKDITERKTLENKLLKEKRQQEETQKELEKACIDLKTSQIMVLQQEKLASIGQIAAGVVHEINNPLCFISSNLQILDIYTQKLIDFFNIHSSVIDALKDHKAIKRLQEKRDELMHESIFKKMKKLVNDAFDGINRINTIENDLLIFSRHGEKEMKPADINEIMESTLNIVWNELKYKAEVKKEYGDIPMITCYSQQLSQVFMNILVNAAYAIDKYGEIATKTWQEKDAIFISISDTGCGIPNENLNKIFEPFFTTKEPGKGTGLGMSISYEIIKKHNGEITCESEPGKETRFTIKLPIAGD